MGVEWDWRGHEGGLQWDQRKRGLQGTGIELDRNWTRIEFIELTTDILGQLGIEQLAPFIALVTQPQINRIDNNLIILIR